jgi:hypothetical protein
MEIEIARVDTLDFDMKRAAFDVAGSGGITGHAVDHGSPECFDEREATIAMDHAGSHALQRETKP